MSDKRFQDCNWFIKLLRYRWYLTIPFKWIWFMYIKPLKIREFDLDGDDITIYVPKNKELWSILIGESQSKMKWFWTHDEVLLKIKSINKD